MPIYQITAPNGKTYRISGPPNATQEQVAAAVLAQNPEAGATDENLLEKIPVVGDLLAGAADLPLKLASNVAGAVKSATDVFGPDNVASDVLEDISNYAESLTSAQSRQDAKTAAAIRKEAEGKGIWEEVKAAVRSATVNPLDTAASLVGSALPFAAAAVAGAPVLAGVGIASGVGTVKGSIADAVYARAREAGVPEEQAKIMADEAQSYSGENLDMQLLGGALGLVASATGFDKQLGRAIAKRAVEDVVENQVERGVIRRGVTGFGAEAIPEAGQAGQERFAQNLAEQRAGYETDLTAGVAGQAAFEGLAGGVLGGVTGMAERGAAAPIATDEEIQTERQAIEAEIAATDIPEAQDPEIRSLAATYAMEARTDIYEALEWAANERDQLKAQAERAAQAEQPEAADVNLEPDLGGREPDISSADGSDGTGGVAGAPSELERQPVGGTGVSAESSLARTTEVERPLAPEGIIPPIEAVSPQAQIAKQLQEIGVTAPPAVEPAAPVALPTQPEISTEPLALPEAKKLVTPERITAARDMLKTTLALPDFEGFEVSPKEINAAAQRMVRTPGLDAPTALFNVLGIDQLVATEAAREAAPAVAPTVELTPETYVDRYLAGEGRGNTPGDLELQQFAANFPAEIEAEFAKRAEPTVAETATVEKVALPPEAQAVQDLVDEYNPGFEIRYNPKDKRRPYKYGIAGQQKNIWGSTSLKSIEKRILNERPVQPKQVIEGVPVKQMPPKEAGGLKKPKPAKPEPAPKGPVGAGKLLPAQEEQQAVLAEIDTAHSAREISNAERAELVNMLRTPEGKTLVRSPEWSLATAVQQEIDKLTKEGRELRTEEKLLAANRKITPKERATKKKELAERAKDIAKRTKEQSKRLAVAKSGIYERTRARLAEVKKARADTLTQAKTDYEAGTISETEYKRLVRETRPQFRQAEGKAAGITLEEMTAAVEAITSRWGANLKPELVQSATDLPAAIRKELEEVNRTDAFGFYKDGKAYLIADNMNSIEDVAPTLYHEALGHLGLRNLFRDGLDDVLNDVYRTNPRVRQLADKWLSANRDLYADENPVARAVEEVLASASEAGPLSAGRMDKIVKFIKDFARKYLGLDLKFSNREVRTILAMAHEQALFGDDTIMGSSAAMYSAPQQRKAKGKVANANLTVEEAIEKTATTTADQLDMESYSRGFFGNLANTIKEKTFANWGDGLNQPNTSNGFIARGGLNTLPTDGVLDYAGTRLGVNPTTKELRNAVLAAERLNANRADTRRKLNRVVVDLKNYMLSSRDSMTFQGKKRKALAVATDYGNYYNIDMVALSNAKTNTDAYKTDAIWRRYTKLLKKPNLDTKTKADYEGKLKQRQTELDGAAEIWSNLSKEGRTLYERVRNMHLYMYKRRQFLLRKKIQSLKDAGLSDENVDRMMISIRAEEERLNDMVNAPSPEDAHKDYPEVPLGQFHREYFPKRRYGKFWLRVKQTKFGEPILRFYESSAERDADLKAFAKEMGVDLNAEGSSKYLQRGNDVETQLGDELDPENAIIKAINMLSDIDPETFTDAKKAKLRGDLYQLYLLGTPEGAGRKQFIKSKNRLGWSSDILRTVGASAEEYATDVARLRYGPEVDQALNAANKSIEDVPTNEQGLARDFINNIQKRIDGEMEERPDTFVNRIVPWANQFAYISFLTAPATALVQVTALPMRVSPHLWGKYGMAATTRAMGRYMNVFSNMPKFEGKETARKTFRIPTLMESVKVKSSKRHRDALSRANNEYGIIMPMSEFVMGERTPQTATAGRMQEVKEKVYDTMTYLFDTSEQLTREVAFMAAYDLEYDKLAGANLSPEERQTKAIIAAKDVVAYTLGDYSNLNRPLIMKGSELARALFLFKQYSVITTRFFVQATRAIFGKNTPRAERVAAIKEMTGVLAMSFMMGGVVGMPLYTLGMMTLQATQDAFDDDEDRRERMKQNPLTADSVEMQFRYEWLPEKFGQPMVTTDKGRKIELSDIILNGAVSELTGWNFGSRVSLDLAGMWFRAPQAGDTWVQTANNLLVENIPGASASLNIVKMGEEFAKGDIAKGLEVGLPAMVRSPIKAYRLATEGLRTQTEKIKLNKDMLENSEIIGTALGFNPTQIANVQKQNRDILGRKKALADKKSELLGDYKRAVRRIQNGDADGQEEARKAFEAIMEYNRKVGNPYFGISYSNIYKSLTGAAAEEKDDIQGMGLNQVESYYAKKMLGEK